ncbi:hypothetical protein ZWY2020_058019 [Hordeum vulgare]|nr:hypothetical protein ZWY2020_058019 [Hordeum vulgare]
MKTEGSFHPPAVDHDGASPSCYPLWVLLDDRAYFADRDNATTVHATTSTGHDVKVTFCLADPPAVSHFCVHCAATSIQDLCATEPRVVSSAKDLALLCFAFRHSWHAAIVPGEDDSFLVADLSLNYGEDLGHYDLHIFSSETNEWSTKHVRLQTPPDVLPLDLPSQTDKVISLGGSTVGWVDLWRGIVVCDVLDKEPLLRFIPLPKADFDLHRRSRARQVRDVVGFPNGSINFVEVEHCLRWFTLVKSTLKKTAERFDVADAISDEELLRHDDTDDVTDDEPVRHAPAGWKLRTMFKSVDWDYWERSHTLHVDDISSAYPCTSTLQAVVSSME